MAHYRCLYRQTPMQGYVAFQVTDLQQYIHGQASRTKGKQQHDVHEPAVASEMVMCGDARTTADASGGACTSGGGVRSAVVVHDNT
ncbi:hypothetical protein GN958_ATG19678 [Phytophthora infestans]|uniref:Uncharacterized protein n=1 Tax=Phytophthora infestans TaxID=4787 RepID=A0A8S9TT35_PHYIN|nr:hypothetical protein GN958_ATG19678 [Phytophthora infestans]